VSKVLLSIGSLLTDANPSESSRLAERGARLWWEGLGVHKGASKRGRPAAAAARGTPPSSHPLHPSTSPRLPTPPDDPLVGSIAQQFLTDRPLHDKTAAEWTKRYATG
jgi:hypothetical protein